MRIAFVSDIHANLQAWNAVSADIIAQKVDKIICLGDVVGYGPSPADVLGHVYAKVHHFVLGNHDAVVAGLMEPTGFNSHARRFIAHTCQQLSGKAKTFFQKVPLAIRCGEFRCTHGNPINPGAFGYLVKEPEAIAAWQRVTERLCFIGHTHRPCLHVLSKDGQYARMGPDGQPVKLKAGHRYIINCGSVGMSRDADFRACYLIYDAEKGSLQWHRVAYDLEAFTQKVKEVYGGTDLAEFLLKRFDAKTPPAVRDLIDFTPGEAAVSESVRREADIEAIRAKAARWRFLAVAAGLLLLLAAGGFYFFWRSLPVPVTISAESQAVIEAAMTPGGFSYQCIPETSYPPGQVPPGWKVWLDDGRTQSVRFAGNRVILVSSEDTPGMELALPRVAISGLKKIQITIHGTVTGPFRGEAPLLLIDYLKANGQDRDAVGNERLILKDREMGKQHTLSRIPEDVTGLRIRLRARFRGNIELEEFSLADPESLKSARPAGPLNINRATAKELGRLPGVGDTLARRIVAYRDKNGPFQRMEDLLNVQGIREATLSKIRDHIRLDE